VPEPRVPHPSTEPVLGNGVTVAQQTLETSRREKPQISWGFCIFGDTSPPQKPLPAGVNGCQTLCSATLSPLGSSFDAACWQMGAKNEVVVFRDGGFHAAAIGLHACLRGWCPRGRRATIPNSARREVHLEPEV